MTPRKSQDPPHPGRAFRRRDRHCRRPGRVAAGVGWGRLDLVGALRPHRRRHRCPHQPAGPAEHCAGRGGDGIAAEAGIGTPSGGVLSSGSYGADRRFGHCRRHRRHHRWIVRRGRLSDPRLRRSGRRRRGIDLAGVLARATRRAAVRSPPPDRRPRWRHVVSGVRCSARYPAERWRIPHSRS